MPNRANLNQFTIDRLGSQHAGIVWDTRLPGFGVRVSPKGDRTGLSQIGAGDAGGVAPYRGGDGKSGQDADRSGCNGGGEPPVCRLLGQGGGTVRRGDFGGRASGPSSGRAENAERGAGGQAARP